MHIGCHDGHVNEPVSARIMGHGQCAVVSTENASSVRISAAVSGDVLSGTPASGACHTSRQADSARPVAKLVFIQE